MSGWRSRELEHDEGGEQRHGESAEPERLSGEPADRLSVDQRIDEHHQPCGDGDRSGDVDAAAGVLDPALGDEAEGEHDRDHADRDVHEKDPLPREQAREHTAEQEADRAASDRHGAPHAERGRALAAFGERRGQD